LLARFALLGIQPAGEGPDALAQEIRRTVTQWREVVRQAGMKVN
jgi:tripartite-type tricarboxylate transporter receptor subunit TctC